MQRKRTVENVAAARLMVEQGARVCDVMRSFGISWTAARSWVEPDYYAQHVGRAAKWQRDNAARVNELARLRRPLMIEAQRDRAAAYNRRRYVENPAMKAKLNELATKYRLTAQYSLGQRIRIAVLGWSGRTAPIFRSMMQAITGCTREDFTRHFDGEGVFDHIVPLAAFDLTNPEQLVRANHPSNLRLVTAKVNNRKHAKHDCADVMSLQWSNNPDAIVQAQSFISRQLANLARRQAEAESNPERPLEEPELSEEGFLGAVC